MIYGTKIYDLINKDKYNVNSIHTMIAQKKKSKDMLKYHLFGKNKT